eukprot:COSAG06_NODE_6354_length_2971_cov_17.682736_1_plen_802_part_01
MVATIVSAAETEGLLAAEPPPPECEQPVGESGSRLFTPPDDHTKLLAEEDSRSQPLPPADDAKPAVPEAEPQPAPAPAEPLPGSPYSSSSMEEESRATGGPRERQEAAEESEEVSRAEPAKLRVLVPEEDLDNELKALSVSAPVHVEPTPPPPPPEEALPGGRVRPRRSRTRLLNADSRTSLDGSVGERVSAADGGGDLGASIGSPRSPLSPTSSVLIPRSPLSPKSPASPRDSSGSLASPRSSTMRASQLAKQAADEAAENEDEDARQEAKEAEEAQDRLEEAYKALELADGAASRNRTKRSRLPVYQALRAAQEAAALDKLRDLTPEEVQAVQDKEQEAADEVATYEAEHEKGRRLPSEEDIQAAHERALKLEAQKARSHAPIDEEPIDEEKLPAAAKRVKKRAALAKVMELVAEAKALKKRKERLEQAEASLDETEKAARPGQTPSSKNLRAKLRETNKELEMLPCDTDFFNKQEPTAEDREQWLESTAGHIAEHREDWVERAAEAKGQLERVDRALSAAATRLAIKQELQKAQMHQKEAELWLDLITVKRIPGTTPADEYRAKSKLAIEVVSKQAESAAHEVKHAKRSLAGAKKLADRGARSPNPGWEGCRAVLIAREKELVDAQATLESLKEEIKDAGLYTALTIEEAEVDLKLRKQKVEDTEDRSFEEQTEGVRKALEVAEKLVVKFAEEFGRTEVEDYSLLLDIAESTLAAAHRKYVVTTDGGVSQLVDSPGSSEEGGAAVAKPAVNHAKKSLLKEVDQAMESLEHEEALSKAEEELLQADRALETTEQSNVNEA